MGDVGGWEETSQSASQNELRAGGAALPFTLYLDRGDQASASHASEDLGLLASDLGMELACPPFPAVRASSHEAAV